MGGGGELISSVKTFRNMIFLTVVACEIGRNRYLIEDWVRLSVVDYGYLVSGMNMSSEPLEI